MEELTERQELFCQYYTQIGDTFGNGVHSYALAYGYEVDGADRYNEVYSTKKDANGKEYTELVLKSSYDRTVNVCGVSSCRLLKVPKIAARIQKLRAEKMTIDFADSELYKVMAQDEDRAPKVAAIREFNAINNRITKRLDLTTGGEKIMRQMTDDELTAITTGSEKGTGA